MHSRNDNQKDFTRTALPETSPRCDPSYIPKPWMILISRLLISGISIGIVLFLIQAPSWSSDNQKNLPLVGGIIIGGIIVVCLIMTLLHVKYIRRWTREKATQLEHQKLLLDKEARLRSIVSAIPVGIGVVVDRIIKQVNDRLCEITGYSREELLNQSARILYPNEETFRQVSAEKYRQIESQGIGTSETQMMHKDGHTLDVILSSTPINPFDPSSGITYTVIDISNRKQAEEEMKRLRNLLKNITDSMPSMLAAVDVTGYIIHWNRETARTTGITSQKAHGKTLSELGKKFPIKMEWVHKAIDTGNIHLEENIPITINKNTLHCDITVYPLVVNEIVEGAVIRIDDVTERKRMHEILVHSEKMLSVGGLAAGMAHEINNPLAAIMQNIQVVRNRIKNDLPKNRKTAEACGITMESITEYMEKRDIFSMIEGIMEAGRRTRDIVNKMVSFSRTSDSKFAPHSVIELMDKTIELAYNDYNMKKKYNFREIEIIKDYDLTIPKVRCEEIRLQQVFLNLLKNSAQAMVENNKRNIPSKITLEICKDKDENMARISVTDNGQGMNQETAKRIFEPFFSTRAPGVGNGLGLAISYFIVTNNHGGTISVESVPGKGTTFIIRLPFEGNIQESESKKDNA